MAWIVGLAGLASGLIGADASRSAANKGADASRYAADMQWKMYDQTRQDNMPALAARNASLSELRQLLGLGGDPKVANYGMLTHQFTGADLTKDPGYQFGFDQGMQALERSAAATGGLFSGATMKALEKYGQDYAGTKFNEAFQRNRASNGDMFDRLASLAGLGQTGASQIGAAGINAASSAGSIAMNNASFQGAAQMYGANQLSNGFNQLAAWASRKGNGNPYTSPNWLTGSFDNPYGDTYDYRGSGLPYDLRGGG